MDVSRSKNSVSSMVNTLSLMCSKYITWRYLYDFFASISQLESKAMKLSPFRYAGNTFGVSVGSNVITMLKGGNGLLLKLSLLPLLPLSGVVLHIFFKV